MGFFRMAENNIMLEGFGYFQDFWSANQATGPILFIVMLVAKLSFKHQTPCCFLKNVFR